MKKSLENRIALETLERYSGSKAKDYQQGLIITNFPNYVEYFATTRKVPIQSGYVFDVAHSKKEKISIIDVKIGSPSAALIIDVCSFLPVKAALLLGMCGGLRKKYQIGNYLIPIASIRGEGTSNSYFPEEVPALANFAMQRIVSEILEKEKTHYFTGITYTTNTRFWEFNEEFRKKLINSKAQGIEMECATLFSASYKHKLPLGALLLISDLPLELKGIKTKKSAQDVFNNFTSDHVEKGIRILKMAARRFQ